ncbi:hypothetical protein AMTRI_Chr02g264580 [Amborella trichopoda]
MAKFSSPWSVLPVILFMGSSSLLLEGKLGIRVELVHCDSPKSPFYNPHETDADRIKRMIEVEGRYSERGKIPLEYDYFLFQLKLGVGEPKNELWLNIDIGSDIMWLDCTTPKDWASPKFKPSQSSSYRGMDSIEDPCYSVTTPSTPRCINKCDFKVQYKDLSFADETEIKVQNIAFGCADNVSLGVASGMIGLGGGPMSLISQLAELSELEEPPRLFERKFAYCLRRGTRVEISIDSIKIGIPNGLCDPKVEDTERFFTYSSFPFTHLSAKIFSLLEQTLTQRFKLPVVPGPDYRRDLCYAIEEENDSLLDLPQFTFHFKGGYWRVEGGFLFSQPSEDMLCLDIMKGVYHSSLGLNAQRNKMIQYDLVENVLSWKARHGRPLSLCAWLCVQLLFF